MKPFPHTFPHSNSCRPPQTQQTSKLKTPHNSARISKQQISSAGPLSPIRTDLPRAPSTPTGLHHASHARPHLSSSYQLAVKPADLHHPHKQPLRPTFPASTQKTLLTNFARLPRHAACLALASLAIIHRTRPRSRQSPFFQRKSISLASSLWERRRRGYTTGIEYRERGGGLGNVPRTGTWPGTLGTVAKDRTLFDTSSVAVFDSKARHVSAEWVPPEPSEEQSRLLFSLWYEWRDGRVPS